MTRPYLVAGLVLMLSSLLAPAHLEAAGGRGVAFPAQTLSVCDYAAQTALLLTGLNSLSIDPNTPVTDQMDNVRGSLNALYQIIAGIQQLTPPSGFGQLHADIINTLQTAAAQLQGIVDAVDAGETPSTDLSSVITPVTAFFSSLTTNYPSQLQQLSACS